MIRRSHRRTDPPPAPRANGTLSARVAVACADLASGLDACAKHAPSVADDARDIAQSLIGARRGSRLRWEWLASTGALLEGAPDTRLLAECAQIADRILFDVARLEDASAFEAARQAAIRVHLLAARVVPLGFALQA